MAFVSDSENDLMRLTAESDDNLENISNTQANAEIIIGLIQELSPAYKLFLTYML